MSATLRVSQSEQLSFSVKYAAFSLHYIKSEGTQISSLRMCRKVMCVLPLTDKKIVGHLEWSIAPNNLSE